MVDHIRIYARNSRRAMTFMPFKNVLEKLPLKQFARFHRSYIVPVSNSRSLLNRRIALHSGGDLPVSNSYVDAISPILK